MAQINVFSPAKINLFLAITGRRSDGFHELVSLVAPLDFGDEIGLRIREGSSGVALKCNVAEIPVDGSNLASKAASLFIERYSIDASVSIDLNKKIPSGAGLGGGSSNAAAVLKALNQRFGACSADALASLAAEIGSDCPLFLLDEPVIMRGRGEKIDRLTEFQKKRLQGLELLLFKPSQSISTPWAYGELARDPRNYMSNSEAESRLNQFWIEGESCKELIFNSFEKPVCSRFRGIREMLKLIDEKAGVPVLLSGSGSCCFSVCSGAARDQVRSLVMEAWGRRVFVENASVAV